MGCVSSKLHDPSLNAGPDDINYTTFVRPNHLVCLTSSTYGILNRRREEDETSDSPTPPSCSKQQPIETINAWELMEGLEGHTPNNKENHPPNPKLHLEDRENGAKAKSRVSHGPLTDLRVESSRYFDSSPLFDPELLASLERLSKRGPLEGFEAKCPPGGQDAVVLYTTTLRGIRKTFEDCNRARCVLESYAVWFSERDVSMHLGFRKEVEDLMGSVAPLPQLFIKGRSIGGALQLVELHERGEVAELLEGIPRETAGRICDGCGGVRFVPCLDCSGSCKLLDDYNAVMRCPECNENGLIHCPICC